LFLAANVCAAATITNVPSDWTTYRVDLVTTQDYNVFGGGPSGDILHMYFDFNRAYLPYITNLVSDGWDCGTYGGFGGTTCFDMTTPDPSDAVQFDDFAVHGSSGVTFEFNGKFIGGGAPWGLTVTDGQISDVGWWNLFKSSPDADFGNIKIYEGEFTIHESILSLESVSGYVHSINDLGKVTKVPEPGTLALFGLGLLGFASRVFRRTA
jgi:hypothetical protein